MTAISRRALGRRLRILREGVGVSQSAAARAVFISPQSIGRLEKGQATRISELHLTALLNHYNATEGEREELLALGRDMRDKQRTGGQWWSAYWDLFPEGLDRMEFEQRATSVVMFSSVLIPQLLHAAEYRRVVERTLHPHSSAADIERRVEMVARRQDRVNDSNFHLQAYMLETVMHHNVGGPAAMNAQLTFLVEISERPTISIRIVPARANSHLGLHTGSFTRMELGALHPRQRPEPPMVYADSVLQDHWIEPASDIDHYEDVIRDLDRVALSSNESRVLIRETAQSQWPVRVPRPEPSTNQHGGIRSERPTVTAAPRHSDGPA
ncbi:helix-turn-helix domain-containing protein [Nocardia macrotermitis]|uniref:HTH cro/C1-type domain-containing protein n=1 Tax=Nocardia macrotermitis TaxID=2585198 RepID=A0A7K0DGC7_9NOCA|nr:helix-turn-helix transcriptional regulator [Nocardia macrotermitis]MQY24352.1 hypothetical protein [Nocardia macrotermitis]